MKYEATTHSYYTATTSSTTALARFFLSEEQYAKRMLWKYKECVGCGEKHIHDDDDYLCWTCRDQPYVPIEIKFPSTSTSANNLTF